MAAGLVATPARAQGQPSQDEAFAAFLAQVRAEAIAKSVSAAMLERALSAVALDPQVLELLNRQPELERTVGQYVAHLLTPARIEAGRAKLAEHASLMELLELRLGVDRHVLASIWSVETNYGTNTGDRSVIRSLATLAHGDPRRPQFWRGELLAALRIVQAGDIAPEAMLGSWAGAMGHTQFMPTTFAQHAIDFDKDGKRDIWGNIGDALGSTANYLKVSGWVTGQPWGFAVALPAGFDFAHSAPGRAKRAAEWQALGVTPRAGTTWPATTGDLSLILPAGAGGPTYLVTANFRAILRYNASQAYALAVGLLADALTSGTIPEMTWPADDRALARAEREELQRLLSALGHDTGGIDGVLGGQSRAAIRAYQRAKALPEDGHPSPALLERVRAEK